MQLVNLGWLTDWWNVIRSGRTAGAWPGRDGPVDADDDSQDSLQRPLQSWRRRDGRSPAGNARRAAVSGRPGRWSTALETPDDQWRDWADHSDIHRLSARRPHWPSRWPTRWPPPDQSSLTLSIVSTVWTVLYYSLTRWNLAAFSSC